MYQNSGRRRGRSQSWSSSQQPSTFRQQPSLRRSQSLGSLQALDGSEGIKYEGNLHRFYAQRAKRQRSGSDQRQQMLDRMRSQVAAQRRANRNVRPFHSTIVPQFKQNQEQISAKRRDRQRIIGQLALPSNKMPESIAWQQGSSLQGGLQGRVFDDDSDLYRERDQQFRDRFNASQRSDRFGSGIDQSYTLRGRLMNQLAQRSDTLRDRYNRNLASYQVREARTPRYRIDRQQRLQDRREAFSLPSTLDVERRLRPIPEVSDIDEQNWFSLEQLD